MNPLSKSFLPFVLFISLLPLTEAQCPKGYGCETGKVIACSLGYYSITTDNSACIKCPAGYRCPKIDEYRILCDPGEYSDPGST